MSLERRKLLAFGQNASEIISSFYKHIILLPVKIMGNKLLLQSWVFYLFIVSRQYKE